MGTCSKSVSAQLNSETWCGRCRVRAQHWPCFAVPYIQKGVRSSKN